MKMLLIAMIVLALAGCATPAPDVKVDNIKDGSCICATIMGPWGSGKTVACKLDTGVIKDGGFISVDANCLMNIQITPPLPKTPPPVPAPQVVK